MRVLSLFDGISCGHVALERAGIPVEVYYASEIDKYAIQITQKNYPDTIQLGDINDIDFTQFIGKVDLVMGGSPCQDLSIAGKRAGLSGDRSGLFYKFVEAIDTIKPKYFLLENNVGMPKDAYEEISRLMGCYPIEINSALLAAQTRKRFYWTNIGPQNYNLFGFPTVAIPQPENKGILLKDVLESGIAPKHKTVAVCAAEPLKIPENTVKGYAEINQIECMDLTHLNSKTRRGRAMKEKCNCLQTSSEFYQYVEPIQLSNRQITQMADIAQKNYGYIPTQFELFNKKIVTDKAPAVMAESYRTSSRINTVFTFEPLQLGHISNTNAQANRVYSVHNKSVTLKANGGGGGAKTGLYKIDLPDGEYLIRKLTPLECERLQTLPDGYTEGVSNTQRYKAIGNGWTVDVIAHIFSYMEEAING